MSGHRVIPHEAVCPACGSFDITTEEVETGDGLTETTYICTACGEAWPLACVTDWTITGAEVDGYDRNGAWDALLGVVSDADGGL